MVPVLVPEVGWSSLKQHQAFFCIAMKRLETAVKDEKVTIWYKPKKVNQYMKKQKNGHEKRMYTWM